MGHVPSLTSKTQEELAPSAAAMRMGLAPREEADAVTAGPLLSRTRVGDSQRAPPVEPRASEERHGAGHPLRAAHSAALPVPARMGRVEPRRAG